MTTDIEKDLFSADCKVILIGGNTVTCNKYRGSYCSWWENLDWVPGCGNSGHHGEIQIRIRLVTRASLTS